MSAKTKLGRSDHVALYDRLKSIEEDAQFVEEIGTIFGNFCVIANERCGTWYIPPNRVFPETVYFMSKDGHNNNWNLSLKRINLHLIPIIAKFGGCILIDSTRKGKRLPDSFSKTVPIWCCCLNHVLNKHRENGINWDESLYVPPYMVSDQEKSEIEKRIPHFVQNLEGTGIDFAPYAKMLEKPLRPIWLTPDSTIFIDNPPDYSDCDFFPVICVSVSRVTSTDSPHQSNNNDLSQFDYTYIQGSGDDHETWSMGLTPRLFWQNKEYIFSLRKAGCEAAVKQVVEKSKARAKNLMIMGDHSASNDNVQPNNSMPEKMAIENFDINAFHEISFDHIGKTLLAVGNIFSGL